MSNSRRSAFTLIEILTVVACISLVMAIAVPAFQRSRDAAIAGQCAANLRSIAQLITAFTGEHEGFLAPVVREKDFLWTEPEALGWDIQVGTWGRVPGGPDTVWRCPGQALPYAGNGRALGLDNRFAFPTHGKLYRLHTSRWRNEARLVLAYDIAPGLTTSKFVYGFALQPYAGDISDEMQASWPWTPEPIVPFSPGARGPHRGDFSAVFADGHAETGLARGEGAAVLWAGPRWWPVQPNVPVPEVLPSSAQGESDAP